jgi:peptidyl-tRNA hydrolase, PTH1 family
MRLRRRRAPESSLHLLVAGLGNPGGQYGRTRHNMGWLVMDELAVRHSGTFRGKFSGRLSEIRVDELRVALLKPETYMNESGRSIAAATSFFKVPPEAVLIVHDDVDLEEGRLQARSGGGLGGHNGLRSIAQAMQTQDFLRLRIGVGRPDRGDPRPVADWVLSAFPPETDVEGLLARAADAVEAVAQEGLEAAQRRFN